MLKNYTASRAAPYALLDLPEFLNDMAFESWHYGTAGHGSATGEPGLLQAWFYFRWFSHQTAVGLGVVLLSGIGMARLARGREARAVVFLLFPALFFALMANQKVSFTRNVLVLLPALAVLAAIGLEWLAVSSWSRRAPRLLAFEAWLRSPEGPIAPEAHYAGSLPTRLDGVGRCGADRALDLEGPRGQSACWAARRLTRLVFDGPRAAQAAGGRTAVTLHAELRSPWPGQRCTLKAEGWPTDQTAAPQRVQPGGATASWMRRASSKCSSSSAFGRCVPKECR